MAVSSVVARRIDNPPRDLFTVPLSRTLELVTNEFWLQTRGCTVYRNGRIWYVENTRTVPSVLHFKEDGDQNWLFCPDQASVVYYDKGNLKQGETPNQLLATDNVSLSLSEGTLGRVVKVCSSLSGLWNGDNVPIIGLPYVGGVPILVHTPVGNQINREYLAIKIRQRTFATTPYKLTVTTPLGALILTPKTYGTDWQEYALRRPFAFKAQADNAWTWGTITIQPISGAEAAPITTDITLGFSDESQGAGIAQC